MIRRVRMIIIRVSIRIDGGDHEPRGGRLNANDYQSENDYHLSMAVQQDGKNYRTWHRSCLT
jgi:hypothetical protein